jgi:hypothetical protein
LSDRIDHLIFAVSQNGVRGLMLDMYDFRNDIWLCHSYGGACQNFTAFVSTPNPNLSLIDQHED